MEAENKRWWNEETKKATFEVTPDDVVLLAAKARVALNRDAALEWLRENTDLIESAIDSSIQRALVMDELVQSGHADY